MIIDYCMSTKYVDINIARCYTKIDKTLWATSTMAEALLIVLEIRLHIWSK